MHRKYMILMLTESNLFTLYFFLCILVKSIEIFGHQTKNHNCCQLSLTTVLYITKVILLHLFYLFLAFFWQFSTLILSFGVSVSDSERSCRSYTGLTLIICTLSLVWLSMQNIGLDDPLFFTKVMERESLEIFFPHCFHLWVMSGMYHTDLCINMLRHIYVLG